MNIKIKSMLVIGIMVSTMSLHAMDTDGIPLFQVPKHALTYVWNRLKYCYNFIFAINNVTFITVRKPSAAIHEYKMVYKQSIRRRLINFWHSYFGEQKKSSLITEVTEHVPEPSEQRIQEISTKQQSSPISSISSENFSDLFRLLIGEECPIDIHSNMRTQLIPLTPHPQEEESKDSILILPDQESQSNKKMYKRKPTYFITGSDEEPLHLPDTIRPNKWVKKMFLGRTMPPKQQRMATCGSDALFYVQCWYGDRAIRLSDDLATTEDFFSLGGTIEGGVDKLFDGFNENHDALFAKASRTRYELFSFHRSPESTATVARVVEHEEHDPFYCGNGILQSITLHPDNSTYVLSGNNSGILSLPCFLAFGDLGKEPRIKIDMQECFRKIIPLGRNIYLGCMHNHRLATIFCSQAKNTDENTLTTVDNVAIETKIVSYYENEKLCEDSFLDVAVDMDCTTSTGFRPRIVLLNTQGQIFVSDVRYGKPTLFMIDKIDLQDKHSYSLFYSDDKVGIFEKRKGYFDNRGLVYEIEGIGGKFSAHYFMDCLKNRLAA